MANQQQPVAHEKKTKEAKEVEATKTDDASHTKTVNLNGWSKLKRTKKSTEIRVSVRLALHVVHFSCASQLESTSNALNFFFAHSVDLWSSFASSRVCFFFCVSRLKKEFPFFLASAKFYVVFGVFFFYFVARFLRWYNYDLFYLFSFIIFRVSIDRMRIETEVPLKWNWRKTFGLFFIRQTQFLFFACVFLSCQTPVIDCRLPCTLIYCRHHKIDDFVCADQIKELKKMKVQVRKQVVVFKEKWNIFCVCQIENRNKSAKIIKK